MANQYSTAQKIQAGSTVVALIAGPLAGAFAIIANAKRSSELFSTEALTNMKAAGLVFCGVTAVALLLMFFAEIKIRCSSQDTTHGFSG